MTTENFDTLATLPVHSYREAILKSVDGNQVTIITAETGAGKSTQVPQYLAEHGYKKIIVTQPRILAARNLSQRVRQEYSWRISQDATDKVGYHTAHERDDTAETVILYCTDGLQLVRELTGSGTRERQVLILDEVHEWNENMEVLVAWAKKRCQESPDFKVVLMSATIESGSLADYYGSPAPIVIPGRSFPVEKRYGSDLIAEVIALTQNRTSNTLVFLPGKSEIENVAESLEAMIPNDIPVIPLHSQLEPELQQAAFGHYPQGKIVLSTNIAQTSVTIDDIDAVVDSGLERRAEVRSGVEGLFIEQISQADCLQRAGRAGRTKTGIYVLAQYDNLPCVPIPERPAYGIPEIMRKHIDRLVLRLANINIDIEDLDFYHAPKHKTVKLAKRTLITLGALTPNHEVTDIGRKMERFPVESSYARMLVEAEHFSSGVQAKLAAIIAIQEVGGIVKGGPRFSGWRKYTRQTQSDLLAQYEVYLSLPVIDEDDYDELGIIGKNVIKAEEIYQRLSHDLGLGEIALTSPTDEETPQLLKCIIAGQLHQIWAVAPGGTATNVFSTKEREVSSSTVVKHASLVVGRPFDLQIPTPQGLETLHLVNDMTAVDPEWLKELMPVSFKIQKGNIYYDPGYGTLAVRSSLSFNKNSFEAASTPVVQRTPEIKKLFNVLFSKWLYEQLQLERRQLQAINFRKIPDVPLNEIRQQVRTVAEGAVSLSELPKKQRIALSRLARLESYLGEDYMQHLNQDAEPKHKKWRHRRPWRFDKNQKRGKRDRSS